jgi:predicted AlkP superfamily phosphohydrolase/phosphomutase
MTKVLLFGIDGAPPELVFDKWMGVLPNIKKLMDSGCYARLNSTIPPSTIVAWNAMFSGKDSSEIGVYSYTYKDEHSELRLSHSGLIQCKLLWDILGEQNKRSTVLYVPLSYPVKPINGTMVSGFLTPLVNEKCTYPLEIAQKISKMGNELFFDVVVGLAGHKALDVDDLIQRTYTMTDKQIALLKELLLKKDWDFFVSVMIGSDRLQHMLWSHFDETHRKFIPASKHKDALKNYYSYLDKKLGEVLELIDDDTVVIVASDHGMIKQEGKININNWLIDQGYLVLKEGVNLTERRKFRVDLVDMEKSVAYGGGAYNARVYINKPKVGEDYIRLVEEISEKLKKIPDDSGKELDTHVYKTSEIYADNSHPECPDLIIYFDDLRWASNPDLGQEGLYSWKTAIGADSAGHSRQGCFVIAGPGVAAKGGIGEINIKQVAPTIMRLLQVDIPEDITVKPIAIEVNE